jgi:DNA topoisomerase 2-associated protein PAT1
VVIDFLHIFSAGDTKFNASQYNFFGSNVMEEVELGGLEDDDGFGDADFVALGDKKYPSIHGRDMLDVIIHFEKCWR